jgi:hypothetical protein
MLDLDQCNRNLIVLVFQPLKGNSAIQNKLLLFYNLNENKMSDNNFDLNLFTLII